MVRQYVGARYVPKFADPVAWTSGTSYEAMTIVTYNNSSYTSKMPVPATVGNPADNPDYWALTGNYNAQVEQYRQEVSENNAQVEQYRQAVSEINAQVEQYRQETENVKINYSKCFNTAANMIADTSLTEGMIVKTLGYNKIADNGGAFYKIYNTKEQNSEHYENLSNGKYALLIPNGYITPEMFGAVGDGVTDDSAAINNAIASGSIVIANRIYHVDAPIHIGGGKTVIITGKIESSTDAIYVNGRGTKVFANEIVAADACIKIANVSSCEHCYFQLYKLTGKYGVVYDGTSWGQYITFIGGCFDCSVHCIHIEHPSDSTGWFNAIYFHDVKCMGEAEYGVYVVNASTNTGLLNGNKFINCGFENNGNAVYLNNVLFFSFSNTRVQEITGDRKALVMEGKNEYVEFHTSDLMSIKRIDISLNTGDNNQVIAPLVFREGSGMTYHAYIDKTVLTYSLRRSRLLNVQSDITMNIDSTVFEELPIYDVFTFRDTSTKHTLVLSPQYGVKGITMIRVIVVGTGVSFKITDSSGHIVTDRENANAGTYLFFSDGSGYWGGGKLA